MNNFREMLENQRRFFTAGNTLSFDFRIQQLEKLKQIILSHQHDIIDALSKDMGKHPQESELTEILLILNEIDHAVKYLKQWMKPVKVKTPFPLLWPGSSSIYSEPYGSVLIISPWNYPFLLLISPLVGSIAAGNCSIVKPSEISTHSQALIIQLINNHFPKEYIVAIHANADETQQLLKEQFDYIYFTGSTRVGKLVMQAAAENLTPVTLELGGKSPCVVDSSADLDFTARRIIMGKMMNAGQTCIAPDYLFVHDDIKNAFINKMKQVLKQFYDDNAEKSDSFGKIININHFNRLKKMLEQQSIVYGGKVNENNCYISPTLIELTDLKAPIMQEEIFGPILPIISFKDINEVIQIIQQHPTPLALYVFTQNKSNEKMLLSRVQFGGGCVNDCVIHIASPELPFGGIGLSGMGKMHGKYSFDTFSHKKSIYKKRWLIDFGFIYPPYSQKKRGWVRRLLF